MPHPPEPTSTCAPDNHRTSFASPDGYCDGAWMGDDLRPRDHPVPLRPPLFTLRRLVPRRVSGSAARPDFGFRRWHELGLHRSRARYGRDLTGRCPPQRATQVCLAQVYPSTLSFLLMTQYRYARQGGRSTSASHRLDARDGCVDDHGSVGASVFSRGTSPCDLNFRSQNFAPAVLNVFHLPACFQAFDHLANVGFKGHGFFIRMTTCAGVVRLPAVSFHSETPRRTRSPLLSAIPLPPYSR